MRKKYLRNIYWQGMKKMKLDINTEKLARKVSKNKRLLSKSVTKTTTLQTKHTN
jgi:hypothetical protein